MKRIGQLEIPKSPVEKCMQINWDNLQNIQEEVSKLKNGIILLQEGGLETDNVGNEEQARDLLKERRFFGYDLRYKYLENNSYASNKQRYVPRSSEEFFYKHEDTLKKAWFTHMQDMEYMETVNEFREEIYKMDYLWIFPKYKTKLKRFNDISGFHLEILNRTLDVVYDVVGYFEEFERSVGRLFEDEQIPNNVAINNLKETVVCKNFFGKDLLAGQAYNFYSLGRTPR